MSLSVEEAGRTAQRPRPPGSRGEAARRGGLAEADAVGPDRTAAGARAREGCGCREAEAQRPALLAGEEGEYPDPHVFRGLD
ncbi:hypothetical protein [Streptomyces barkulensis]|uniref:hypothetical protein n=1 Tax=Streptomyces barkulensis TaxID=1257026 RepID=UPI000C6C99AC|nr:hypothetical protein [Streptomyces barkulensis]